VNHLITILKKKIPSLFRIKDKLNKKSKLHLYYAFIYPHIMYASILYGNTSLLNKKRLQKLQNKILRILFFYNKLINTNGIYKNIEFEL